MTATLAEEGHQVDVLTGKPNYPQGEIFAGYRAGSCQIEERSGVSIFRVPLIGRGKGAIRLAINYLAFIFSSLVFAPWILRKRRFDVIFVFATSPILQALPALCLGWLRNAPVVIWVQDLWPESLSATGYVTNRRLLAMVGLVVKFIYSRSSLLLVQSEGFLAPVTAYANGTPVRYLPNSVDMGAKESQTEVNLEPSLFDGFVVMFTGNIGAAQSMEVVLEAAVLLQDVADIRFVIVGDGSRREWTAEKAAGLGLGNFMLPGAFPLTAMAQLMARASVLLVSLADEEVFNKTVPSKIQAYMAAGRPIVGSLNGVGARLITAARAGLAVPAGDPGALAGAIRAMYALSAAEREKMGCHGRSYFNAHFGHSAIVGQLVTHLEDCVKNGKKH